MSTITRLAPEQWQLLLRLDYHRGIAIDARKLMFLSDAAAEHLIDLEDRALINTYDAAGAKQPLMQFASNQPVPGQFVRLALLGTSLAGILRPQWRYLTYLRNFTLEIPIKRLLGAISSPHEDLQTLTHMDENALIDVTQRRTGTRGVLLNTLKPADVIGSEHHHAPPLWVSLAPAGRAVATGADIF